MGAAGADDDAAGGDGGIASIFASAGFSDIDAACRDGDNPSVDAEKELNEEGSSDAGFERAREESELIIDGALDATTIGAASRAGEESGALGGAGPVGSVVTITCACGSGVSEED